MAFCRLHVPGVVLTWVQRVQLHPWFLVKSYCNIEFAPTVLKKSRLLGNEMHPHFEISNTTPVFIEAKGVRLFRCYHQLFTSNLSHGTIHSHKGVTKHFRRCF